MKLVTIADLKSAGEILTGSSPVSGTNTLQTVQRTVLAQTCFLGSTTRSSRPGG